MRGRETPKTRLRIRRPLIVSPTYRIVGFVDAVRDLGTHKVHGYDVPYTRQTVYSTLHGKYRPGNVLRRIIERRPDMLDLPIVAPEVRERAKAMGWEPAKAKEAQP